MSAERSEQPDDLYLGVEVAIAACDGDPRAAVRALIVANNFLTEQVDMLAKELRSELINFAAARRQS